MAGSNKVRSKHQATAKGCSPGKPKSNGAAKKATGKGHRSSSRPPSPAIFTFGSRRVSSRPKANRMSFPADDDDDADAAFEALIGDAKPSPAVTGAFEASLNDSKPLFTLTGEKIQIYLALTLQ